MLLKITFLYINIHVRVKDIGKVLLMSVGQNLYELKCGDLIIKAKKQNNNNKKYIM